MVERQHPDGPSAILSAIFGQAGEIASLVFRPVIVA
jgi:hypothetical protein